MKWCLQSQVKINVKILTVNLSPNVTTSSFPNECRCQLVFRVQSRKCIQQLIISTLNMFYLNVNVMNRSLETMYFEYMLLAWDP